LYNWTTEKSTFGPEQLQEFADALVATQPTIEWVPVSKWPRREAKTLINIQFRNYHYSVMYLLSQMPSGSHDFTQYKRGKEALPRDE
jgi:hypothetical protein